VNRDRVYNAARDAKRNAKPKNFSLGWTTRNKFRKEAAMRFIVAILYVHFFALCLPSSGWAAEPLTKLLLAYGATSNNATPPLGCERPRPFS
jgi:hypothetical protein